VKTTTFPFSGSSAVWRPSGASPALTLVAMSLGFAVVQLDVTVVNVALKTIGSSLGGGIAGLQWVVNAYTVVFASLILTSGALGDRFGAKRLFIAGFVLFVAASMACGAAPNLITLIIARALQGIGASVLVPCSLSLLDHSYQDPESRAKAVGIWAGVADVALAGGPVIGGVLIAGIGWRAIFFINLPLGLLGIWLTACYASESTQSRDRPLDLAGQTAAIVAVAALAAAMIEGGAIGRINPLVIAGFGAFILAGGLFVAIETSRAGPMLPLSFFGNRTFSAASVVGFLINLAFYGLIFTLSIYFQQIRNFSPFTTGLAFMPMTAVVVAANVAAGQAAARFGARLPMILGQAMFAAGCLFLTPIGTGQPYSHVWWQTVLMGAGIGLTVPPMTSALLATVEREQSGVASGVLNTTRQLGSVIGVALFGSLIANRDQFIPGMHLALLISAAVLLVGILAAFFGICDEQSASAADRPDSGRSNMIVSGTCGPAAAVLGGPGQPFRNESGGPGPAGCRRGCRAAGARTGSR
jgi:MFS transporter, DHA2 family, methylenomycin A resistance protein